MTGNFNQEIKNNLSFGQSRSSFTLIELLVTLAIVAVLSVVVILTLNPAELLKQARDSNRLSDLATINTALNLFSTDVIGGFMGTSTVVYVSLPDNSSSTCGSWGLPALPTGYTYNCVSSANLRNTNGTGWIPVNFNRISSNSPISQLPIDPQNTTSTGSYYTYVTGGSWHLASNMESTKQKSVTGASGTDGGISLSSYEIGNNLRLIPSGLLEWKRDSSLVGYWTFDEGSGTTAYDWSGYGNNGTYIGVPTWTNGKFALSMDSIEGASYVSVPDNNSLDLPSELTISAWIKYISTPVSSGTAFPIQKWSGTALANYVWYWYSAGSPNPNGNAVLANMGGNWATMNSWYTLPADSTWRHFVQTYSASGSRNLYIDGVLVKTTQTPGGTLITNSVPLLLGQLASGFRANFDDFRIYNKSFSAAEVFGLYSATK